MQRRHARHPTWAQGLIDATFDGLDAAPLWDAHTHLLGTLRQHNPLLFDLALMRRAAWRGARLSAAVFQTRDHVVDPRRNRA